MARPLTLLTLVLVMGLASLASGDPGPEAKPQARQRPRRQESYDEGYDNYDYDYNGNYYDSSNNDYGYDDSKNDPYAPNTYGKIRCIMKELCFKTFLRCPCRARCAHNPLRC